MVVVAVAVEPAAAKAAAAEEKMAATADKGGISQDEAEVPQRATQQSTQQQGRP